MARLLHSSLHYDGAYGVLLTVEPDGAEGLGVSLYDLYEAAVARLKVAREKQQAYEIEQELDNMQRYGAKSVPCRKEDWPSVALPPPTWARKKRWLRSIPNRKALPQVRLYLWKAGDDAVLFAGGLKTTTRAQDCDNIKGSFAEAGAYGRRLAAELGQDLQIVNDHLRLRIGRHTIEVNDYDF